MQIIEEHYICPICTSKNQPNAIGAKTELYFDVTEPVIIQEKQMIRRDVFDLHFESRHFGLYPPDYN